MQIPDDQARFMQLLPCAIGARNPLEIGVFTGYFERCLTLLRPDGVMLFDNALWDGRVAGASNEEPDTVAIRELNRLVAADPRVDACLAVCGDGIHIARKK